MRYTIHQGGKALHVGREAVPIRFSAAAPRGAPSPGGPVQLLTYAGLGDILGAATVAYAFAEAAYPASVGYREADYSHAVTAAPLESLPFPALLSPADGRRVDLTGLPGFEWATRNASMLDLLSMQGGAPWHATPRTACLRVLPHYAQTARALVGEDPYALIAPVGHAHGVAKRLSSAQIAAAAAAAIRADLRPVVVGRRPVGTGAGLCNLAGQTSIEELCALVSQAALVVSAETGTAHLAAAYQVPCVWVCPSIATPWGVLADYAPVLVLEGRAAADVPSTQVAAAIERMAAAIRAPWYVAGPDTATCGVAETGRRMAARCGVPYHGRYGEDPPEGVAIIEVHGLAPAAFPGRPEQTVVSLHTSGDMEFRVASERSSAILFRESSAFRSRRHQSQRAYYVPLPCLDGSRETVDRQAVAIGWHGIAHAGKGLFHLVEAWRRVRAATGAHLLLCASVSTAPSAPAILSWLRELDDAGLHVCIRPHWTDGELVEALSGCAVLCYPDTAFSAEQSAASADALGFGVPVVVSDAPKHDDVRGWCVTSLPENLATALLGLLQDRDAYQAAAARARMGGSFRRPEIVARQYRAAAIQAALG